jgi:autotransporter-associated beta strand protein
MNLPRALLLAAAVVLSVAAVAAPIQTNYGTGDGSIPGGAMPTSNLLATNLVSASRTGTGDAFFYREDSGYTVDLARLYDGQFGTAGGNQAFTVMPNVVSLTFNLNLATRPTGYDIASIKTYASWDSGRDGQAYTVQYSTAANPNQFSLLAAVSRYDNTNFPQIPNPMYMPGGYNPMADYFLSQYNQAIANNDPMAMFYWDMYNYELNNSEPQYYEDDSISSTMVGLTDTSGVLASGVAALRFNFSGVENGGTAFREFVVEGVAGAAPTTISTTITASDTRVTGGNTLQFQGGTLAPVGVTTLNLASGIEVLASSTGTLDATSQNISSSGAVTISGTSLTLTGSTTSAISLAGLVSGAGGLINDGGVNTLAQGSAYTGATVVSGGKLIQVGTSQSSSNQIAAGATLEFNQASGIVSSGNTTFNGAGILLKTGAGSLGWGVTSATFSFSRGAMIHVAEGNFIGGSNWSEVWTDNHSDLRVDAGARFSGVEADVRIDRLLGAGVVATGLGDPRYHGFTIGVDGGDGFFTGTIIDSDTASGDLGKVVKVGAGELTLTGSNAYSGGTTLQAGALRAGNNAAFGSGTITLNAGVLSSDGSAARTLANVVHIAGAVTLGDAVKDGALTLAGAVSASSGTVVTFASDVILSGTATSTGVFTKAGTGALTLDAAGTIATGTLVVSGGLLTNNGLINGVVTVASAGTLGGSGTIAGTVTVAGILAPGNSPGLLTQTTGDLNLTTGSHFLAELGGTTAGNGNGFHDQYFVSNGAINIANGVTLDVKSWLAADGITTFAPVRTNVFSVLKASNGIAGVFSDFTNADYSQWLLFDNSQLIHSPGNLYGTGLNGNQTFAAYGTTAARAAVGASLWAAAVTPSTSSTTANPAGFIYAGSSSGAAAIGLLTAVDADAYLAALSPEAYLAAGDYALTIARSVSEAAFGQASLIKTGDWTLGAGYNRTQHGYRGADATSNYELSGNTSLVTLTRDFGPHCSVGFFFGYNTGKTVANNANLDYRGNVFGLTSVGRYEGKHPVTLKAAVVSSDIRFDAVRNGSTANDQTLRSLSGQLTASLELYKEGRLTFSPLLGFVQGRSTSDAFAEAGSGARLNVNALERKSARGLAGLGATYILSNDLQLDFAFAYEYEFADAPTAATASFVDAATTVPMTIEHALVDRSTTSGTLGANWKIDNSVTLRLSAEARGNRELHKDYRYNVGLNVRF